MKLSMRKAAPSAIGLAMTCPDGDLRPQTRHAAGGYQQITDVVIARAVATRRCRYSYGPAAASAAPRARGTGTGIPTPSGSTPPVCWLRLCRCRAKSCRVLPARCTRLGKVCRSKRARAT